MFGDHYLIRYETEEQQEALQQFLPEETIKYHFEIIQTYAAEIENDLVDVLREEGFRVELANIFRIS